MNKYLCVLICFLVGILIYLLIRSYCSCNVIEGLRTDPCETALCEKTSAERKKLCKMQGNKLKKKLGAVCENWKEIALCRHTCPAPNPAPNPEKKYTCKILLGTHGPSKCTEDPTGTQTLADCQDTCNSNCDHGYYLKNGICTICSITCPSGEYKSVPCTADSDITCQEKICTCKEPAHGTPSRGLDCPKNGDEKCKTCNAGWGPPPDDKSEGSKCTTLNHCIYPQKILCPENQHCKEGKCVSCPEGSSGPNCEIPDPCINIKCGDHGKCQSQNGKCKCNDGWKGAHCGIAPVQPPPNPCINIKCAPHGTCDNGKCVCNDGWTGVHCETELKLCKTYTCPSPTHFQLPNAGEIYCNNYTSGEGGCKAKCCGTRLPYCPKPGTIPETYKDIIDKYKYLTTKGEACTSETIPCAGSGEKCNFSIPGTRKSDQKIPCCTAGQICDGTCRHPADSEL